MSRALPDRCGYLFGAAFPAGLIELSGAGREAGPIETGRILLGGDFSYFKGPTAIWASRVTRSAWGFICAVLPRRVY